MSREYPIKFIQVRVARLVKMHANQMEDVDTVRAGDIFAVFGVDCASGDTFCSRDANGISMESIYVPEPVVSMSIRPEKKEDGDNFSKGNQIMLLTGCNQIHTI